LKNKCDFCEKEFFGNGIVVVYISGVLDVDLAELLCSEKCRKKPAKRNEEIGSLFA
jgi:hypothetical protein